MKYVCMFSLLPQTFFKTISVINLLLICRQFATRTCLAATEDTLSLIERLKSID